METKRSLFSRWALVGMLTFALGFSACSGDDGSDGKDGQAADMNVVNEARDLAQEAWDTVNPVPVTVIDPETEAVTMTVPSHAEYAPAARLDAEITGVTLDMAGDGSIALDFNVDGLADPDRVSVELTVAKWIESEGIWLNLIQRDVFAGDGPKVIRGGNVRPGTIVGSGGSFTGVKIGAFDFNTGVVWRTPAEGTATNYAPEAGDYQDYVQGIIDEIEAHLGNAWDAAGVYRAGVTSRQGERFTATYYFDGNGDPADNPGLVGGVDLNSCTSCHSGATMFAAHGNRRNDPELCTSCHNPYTFDRSASVAEVDGWVEISLMTMVHKIHNGMEGYTVDGKEFGDTRFPDWGLMSRNIGAKNCVACHQGDVPAANSSWNTASIGTCSSCHPDLSAVVPHGTTDAMANCSGCHNGVTQPSAEQFHGIQDALELIAARDELRFAVVKVENAVAGQTAQVTWGVQDELEVFYDLNDLNYADQVRVGLGWGWGGEDWINDGVLMRTTGGAGDPLYVVANGDNTTLNDNGTATTVIGVLPENAIAGRNAYAALFMADPGKLTHGSLAVDTYTEVRMFDLAAGEITDFAGTRRDIVAMASCNDCHGVIFRHGTVASDITGCITCHNPGSLSRNASTVQGTVDMMYIVHALHSVNDASGKRQRFDRRRDHGYQYMNYPNTILECGACHTGGSENSSRRIALIGDGKAANYYADGTGANSPLAMVCFSCHQDGEDLAADLAFKSHATNMGGNMHGAYTHAEYLDPTRIESCMICHN